ncbi:MAG: aminopeptidase N, partial [Gammaproteobacteria bacterium]|nr:aminopeptidase N [Gammaproteobacteria bacterium]
MTENSTPKTIYLDQYQPPGWKVKQANLDFDLREGETLVKARLDIENSNAEESDMFLNGENLELVEISVNGSLLDESQYQVSERGLVLLKPPENFELETLTRIYPEKNTALEGLYRSTGMYCTQCEAEGFRKITWFPDRPDVMASFTTRVEADKSQYPVLLSNGNPADSGELDHGRHYAVWDDPFPKPSYLFALVAGDLKAVSGKHTTPSGREITLNIYIEAENIDKCDHALHSLINAMKWDEEKYGREYDLDIYNVVAVNDFNMGAMENKGLNIFNSKYVLARKDTATDRDFQGIEAVIAHEYFHNWTGNRITCRDWFQLSLKEGFTVFRDQCFSADMGSQHVKRIEDVRLLRAHQFAEDAGPMAHPVRPASYIEINNFYTVTVYEKGAEVVRMQANLLGAEKFRQATDLYFERFDGQAVTTEEFMGCMQDTLGRDMSQFQHWYDYAGTPELKVQGHYDVDKNCFDLTISQSCPDTPEQTGKPPFFIPFAVGLLGHQGNDLIGTSMLELTQPTQVFSFKNIDAEPVPSLLRGFSAPVKVSYQYTDDELMFLMENDTDGFARWDAAQQLSQRILLSMIRQHQHNKPLEVSSEFIEAFRNTLLDENSDKALLAEVITLPSESYLGDQMQQVDVDAIHLARKTLKQKVADTLYEDLLGVYQDNEVMGEYRITSDAIAR